MKLNLAKKAAEDPALMIWASKPTRRKRSKVDQIIKDLPQLRFLMLWSKLPKRIPNYLKFWAPI
jgi:hypothetical protein